MPDRPSFPIPENLTPETCCLCIQMPQDETWKAVIAGLLFQPAEWFNWQRDEDKSGKELAQYWRKIYNEIDWSIMSCCCNDIPLSRFTSDGHYQTSNDGGATWQDATNQDPRNASPQIPPALPPETITPECTYADSVINFFEDGVIDVLEEGDTVQQVVAIIGGILAAVFGAGGVVLGVIGALIAALAAGIVGLGITAVKNAFTDDVWNELRCLLYANINPDGSFSQAQLDTIYANVPGDTIAQTVLRSWIAALGITGMTNSARLLMGSPDAACNCDCPFDTGYAYSPNNWDMWIDTTEVLDTDDFAVLVRQLGLAGWYANGYGIAPNNAVGVLHEYDSPCSLSSIIVEVDDIGSYARRLLVATKIGGSWTINSNTVRTDNLFPAVSVSGPIQAIQIQFTGYNPTVKSVQVI